MKFLTFVVILHLSVLTFSQNYRFGKVSEEDFETFATPLDPADNATVIYKKQYIRFIYRQGSGFTQTNEIHERIIIHNKEGFDWATRKIRLYNRTSANSESVQDLKGYTYTMENGKIEREKLKREGVFEEEANKYWKYQTFTMPNVKEGCIVEFTYEILSPFSQIDDIDLQYEIPILNFDLKIVTPEYFIYNKLLNPMATYNPSIEQSKSANSITFTSKERVGTYAPKTETTTSVVDYLEDVLTVNTTNIPALRDEPLVSNLDNYRAKLVMELTSVQYPNEPVKSFSSTWEDVTKTIYNDDDFGNQLNKTGYYEDDLTAIISDQTDDLKKIYQIHEFVKSKMKWNGFFGHNSENGVKKAYKEGVGNIGDINLMLISMLRTAGFNADPVLISTKNNGIPLLPTRTGFNYVICAVEINDDTILLDATQKFSTADVLPIMSLNWMGRVIRNNGSSDWIQLSTSTPSKEYILMDVELNQDLSAHGKIRSQLTDYQAYNFREKYQNYSEQQVVESIEKGKGEFEVTNLTFENRTEIYQPLKLSYDYTNNNVVEEIGDKLYFSPMLFLTPKENPFKSDNRNFPIDFVYPIADKYMINIKIPEGYAVETLPESGKYQLNESDGAFIYMTKLNGNFIQFTISFDLSKTLILPTEYENFKKFYQLMVEKETEKVVLKKV